MKKVIRKGIYLLFYFILKRIKKLKNIAQDDTVYLIGDSAELKYYDIDFFDNHPAIFFNKSFLINDVQKRKNKTYVVTVEPYYYWGIFCKKNKKNGFRKFSLKKIITEKTIFIASLSNVFLSIFSNIYLVFEQLPGDNFTKELKLNGLKFNAGAFQASLSLALYMGFKNIYIVGVSFHQKSLQNHWYRYGTGIKNIDETERGLNTEDRHLFFNILKKHVNTIKVITYIKSSSIFFDTISYEYFSGLKLNYKESDVLFNSDLLPFLSSDMGRF